MIAVFIDPSEPIRIGTIVDVLVPRANGDTMMVKGIIQVCDSFVERNSPIGGNAEPAPER